MGFVTSLFGGGKPKAPPIVQPAPLPPPDTAREDLAAEAEAARKAAAEEARAKTQRAAGVLSTIRNEGGASGLLGAAPGTRKQLFGT